MGKFKAVVLGFAISATVCAAYKLYKEIKFLHKVAMDTMFVNTKMDILYSEISEDLFNENYTDADRVKAICKKLTKGWKKTA